MTLITPQEYLNAVNEERKEAFQKLYTTIKDHMPAGFEDQISYGMIGWVVPHSLYPAGYHCAPHLPLPFLSIAAQKNFFAVYHMGMYAEPDLLHWFTAEYPNYSQRKLDMGKSCIRFKNTAEIPFDLIGKLCRKMSVEDWIQVYEEKFKK